MKNFYVFKVNKNEIKILLILTKFGQKIFKTFFVIVFLLKCNDLIIKSWKLEAK